jgi:hypothetical protein
MPEWLSQDWWRWVWVPALGVGFVWLAATNKTQTEARGARDARLDARQDRMLEQADTEIEDLRAQLEARQGEADHWERVARWWFRTAHNLSHSLLSARMAARRALLLADKPVPETWDEPAELPPLESPWTPDAPHAAE